MEQLQHASTKANGEANDKARHGVKMQATLRGRACKACTNNTRTERSTGDGTSQNTTWSEEGVQGQGGKEKTL